MSVVDEPENNLEPLTYHIELRDYLKSEEPELWKWFASVQAKADYIENLRLELLKSTYRLDIEGHPELYHSLAEAKNRLQIDMPVTLYQAENSPQLNAALFYAPGQGHIVFSGPVFERLNTDELKSVIGHELAHYQLWGQNDGEFHIADRLINAVALDPRASGSHKETARRYRLYTEIFADRGSLHVTRDPIPVVASLVKIQTGLSQVSAASYLKQAEEIFANGNVATEGISHPEVFIRARAITLWQEQLANAAPKIHSMIEGATTFEDLDLVGQKRLTLATRRLLEYLLQPKWFQTPAVLGHAKLFFTDFKPPGCISASLLEDLKPGDPKLGEYLCYVMLDFTKADPDLDDLPLAAAFEMSRHLGIDEQFERLAAKELHMKARELRKIKEQAAGMVAKAEVSDA